MRFGTLLLAAVLVAAVMLVSAADADDASVASNVVEVRLYHDLSESIS